MANARIHAVTAHDHDKHPRTGAMRAPLQPRPAAVIFDCDGVLVDTEDISHGVLTALLADCGFDPGAGAEDNTFRGQPLAQIRAEVEARLGQALPEDFDERFRVQQFAGFRGRVHAMPGVAHALEQLDLPFRVCTNGTHAKMRFTLKQAGILALVDGRLMAHTDVGRPKPAPDLFLHAAADMGVAARDCLVVEDTLIGMTAARAAGMRAIAFAGPGAACVAWEELGEHCIADMRALLQLLGPVGADSHDEIALAA